MKKALSIILGIIAVIIVGVILLVYINPGPSVQQTEETEWLKTTPISHRGFHTDDAAIPENSIAAFQAAIEEGYAIELDVLLTADGEVVVFHDVNLLRMTGVDRDLSSMSWSELQELRLLESEEGIPSLAEVLSLVDGQVPLLIEIKNEDEIGELEEKVLQLVANYEGAFAIQAFNPFVLGYFKEHAPEIIRGQLSGSFKNEDLELYKRILLKNLLLNSISAPHFIAYEFDSMPNWMAKRQKAKNLYLLAWTIKSAEQAEAAQDKYDNIIFELFHP